MKLLHLGCSDDIREGFDNLDAKTGWRFEDGLPYENESVDGITISHALMYVAPPDLPYVMSEFYRVLKPSGVVRITEDDIETPASARHNDPYPGARLLTGPSMMRHSLQDAGLLGIYCTATETCFSDNSLLIAHREKTPWYVFYIEGLKI